MPKKEKKQKKQKEIFTFARDELIENVRKETDIGKKIIEVEMTFLRALKDGILSV